MILSENDVVDPDQPVQAGGKGDDPKEPQPPEGTGNAAEEIINMDGGIENQR
jgi:hypothetical protein